MLDPPVQGSVHPLCPSSSAPNSVLSASLSRTTHTSPNTCNSARGSFASTWAHSVSSIRSQPPEPQSAAAPSPLHLANICHRRTRTLDLSTQPHILPRSSSISKNKLRVSFASTTPSSSPSSSSYHHRSTCSLPISPSMPSTSSAAQVETTPKAGPSRFPISATTMSAKPTSKRNSLLGSISVADRAKKFQSESASVAPPNRPAKSCVRKTSSSPVTQPASVATSAASPSSSPLLLSSQASCSSSQAATSHNNDTAKQSNAVIKHARRISVSTPMHRRARSDASMIDPHFGHDASSSSSASSGSSSNVAATNPPTIRTTSFAEIEELTAKLEANRPRSKTLERPYRGRANSVLMQSIAEENMQLRLCSSTETIRGLNPAGSRASGIDARLALKESHVNFQVSPCLSEDGSIDWHCFVTGNYGVTASFDFRQPISITDLAFPISKRKQIYKSKLAKADSPTLNDEATWLEEELARCSSDEEDDEHNPYGAVRHSIDEEYLTPDGSPLLSPVNVMAPPPVEIMGLGIQDVSLLIPGEQKDAEKSADSLLEQVAMHEACIQTLRTLSHDEREQATAIASATNNRQQLHLGLPSMPDRRSSLVVPPQYPALRGVGSNGDFSATQSDSSALFGEDSYDASMSPMADMGHGAPSNDFSTDSAGERRASAASYLSTDSTASADLSIASHGSSLLFNAHLAAPGMERGGSADTAHSTRPSSIASSYCHDKAPIKPPRSPFRMNSLPLPPLPQEEACETPQLSHQSQVEAGLGKPLRSPLRMNAMPLPPLPHESAAAAAGKPRSSKESTRVLRQASRRKEGTDLPLPPARLDSLDAMVAAAPKEMQLKEEFPDRLLGDWMTAESPAVVEKHEEHGFSVEPVPLHKRIRKQDGTTYLPGLGEIVPPSPDVAANMTLSAQDIPIYPAALKRLGLEPSASMLSPTASAVVANGTGLTKSTTLKSKLSGRLGLSSKEDDSSSLGAGVKVERKVSESSLPNVLGRMRKSSGKNESRLSSAMTLTAAAELPAAWKDRIKRPSIDTRRPSLASLTSSSTHSSSTSASSKISGAVQQRATAIPLPTIQSHDSRSRSSLGFRKMLSSITGVESIPSSTTSTSTVNTTTTPSFSTFTEPSTSAPTTLEALAATTFESPLRRRPSSRSRTQQYQSFIQLSDDEDSPSSSPSSSSSSSSPCSSSVVLPKGSGKKDLTKMFGASQVDLDLSHPPTSAATAREDNKRWTASLGRSSAAKKRSGLW